MGYTIDTTYFEHLLKNLGISSHSELAQQCGLHRNTLTPYVNGKRSIYTPAALAIAKALSITPLELLGPNQTSSNLNDQLLKLIDPIISQHNNLNCCLFGSRSRGDYKKFSDFDLGLSMGEKKLETDQFLDIQIAVEDAVDDFPVSINLVNLDHAPRDFIRNIYRDLKFFSGNVNSFHFLKGKFHGFNENQQI